MFTQHCRKFHIAIAVLLFSATNCFAGGSNASGEVGLDLHSAYVWRGQVLNDELVADPSVTLESGNWSFNTWGSFDLTDNHHKEGQFAEVDLTLAYAVPLEGPVSTEVGVIQYLFPESTAASTREVYVSLGFDDMVLSPSVTAYWDVDAASGFYIVAEVSQGVDLIEDTLSASVGFSSAFATEDYNQYYFGVDDSSANDGNVSLSLGYALTEDTEIGAAIIYTWLWDNDIEDSAAVAYDDDDQLWGGIHISKHFS